VFSNLGIAPGTLLVSDVVLPADVRFTLEPGEALRLGRARKDDFGQVRVVNVQVVPPQGPAGLRPGEHVAVWCVSDVLLRDDWGAPDPSPAALAAALSYRLGAEMTVVPQAPDGPVTQAHRAARRESFHTRWGRPRPTLTGLQAGSVVTLVAAGEIPASALAEIERDGIGERTAEGFGRVRFGGPELAVPEPRLVPGGRQQAGPEPARQAPAGELPAAPHILEQVAVMSEVGRRVAQIVVGEAGFERVIPGTGRVTRSQWGSLREQLPRLRTEAGRQTVIGWLDKTGDVPQRLDAWSDPALDALARLFTDRAAIWAELGLDGATLDELTLAPGRAEVIRDALWADAVAALLTKISRAACRRLQSGPGEGDQP
jgi:CRISPR-associated protein Csx10